MSDLLRVDDTDDVTDAVAEEAGEGVTTGDCARRRGWGEDGDAVTDAVTEESGEGVTPGDGTERSGDSGDGEYSLDDGVGMRLLSDIVRDEVEDRREG